MIVITGGRLRGFVNDDTSWLTRFRDYEAALDELQCVSRALNAVIMDRGSQGYQKLLDAEAVAREHVVRTRTRLMDLYRGRIMDPETTSPVSALAAS